MLNIIHVLTFLFKTSMARFLMLVAVGPLAVFNCILYFRNSLSRSLIFFSTVFFIKYIILTLFDYNEQTF